jgi:hypothetical protein
MMTIIVPGRSRPASERCDADLFHAHGLIGISLSFCEQVRSGAWDEGAPNEPLCPTPALSNPLRKHCPKRVQAGAGEALQELLDRGLDLDRNRPRAAQLRPDGGEVGFTDASSLDARIYLDAAMAKLAGSDEVTKT